MTKLRLFALVIPLTLLGSLPWAWRQLNESAESTPHASAKLSGQKNTIVANDARGDLGNDTPSDSRSTPASPITFTDAEFNRHVNDLNARIKKQLPPRDTPGFSIVIQKPFVVIGDEPQKVVQQRAENTVKWAVDRLKQDFFTKDPNYILDIWLFKDEASYEKHARLFFGDSPGTPLRLLLTHSQGIEFMNIGTEGGTLVHEIVHRLWKANFPSCPPWLNEGLGSSTTVVEMRRAHSRIYHLATVRDCNVRFEARRRALIQKL